MIFRGLFLDSSTKNLFVITYVPVWFSCKMWILEAMKKIVYAMCSEKLINCLTQTTMKQALFVQNISLFPSFGKKWFEYDYIMKKRFDGMSPGPSISNSTATVAYRFD